jgi:hypothetical protein
VKTRDLRDSVEGVLAAVVASKGPTVTEQQFLRELIGEFANTGMIGDVLASIPDLNRDVGNIERVHAQFRADLQALIENRLKVADRKRIYTWADRVLMVPRTAQDGALKYQYVPAGPEAATAHAMRLLLDPVKKQYREDLKQCQWKDCNRIENAPGLPHVRRFFFVSERREAAAAAGKKGTGKLPDQYCSETHMRAAHRARATEATIKRRKLLRERKEQAAARLRAKHR